MPVTSVDTAFVFLSYSRQDSERAAALAEMLTACGVTVWLDRTRIEGGTSWSSKIVDGIAHCAALVLPCTPAAMQSRNVR